MTDKRLSSTEVSPRWEGSVVDGLFKWTDATQGVPGTPVQLKADGPPVEVGLSGAGADNIGILVDDPVLNALCKVTTKYVAIVAIVAGGTIAQGAYVKINASAQAIQMVVGDFADGAAFGAKFGQALQSAVVTDVIYVGIGG